MENETKHTPGPWTCTSVGNEKVGAIIGQEGGKYIARTFCYGVSAEDNANAFLIAAAPDLLFAAQQTLDALCELGQYDLLDEAVHILRAAIAKAEGREVR